MLNEYGNKRILITGGLGMIGSSVAVRLVEQGADVTIVDACLDDHGYNQFNISGIEERVKVIKSDIRDKRGMRPLIEKSEIIFNFAGQVSHNDSINNPLLDADINYTGHLNILELVRTINPKIKIIFPGTRMSYGKIEELPVREDHPLRPLSPYALNKAAAENLYLFYNRHQV